ncbi:MAG: hypothetical protein M1830_007065, partial [Pleopsidium flavum]
MAYPFPRFSGSPQTPQHVKGIESPRSRMSPGPNSPNAAYKRLVIVAVVCIVLFLCIINPFSSKTSKQSDRIPFSHDLVDEWVFLETLLNFRANIVQNSYFKHFEGHQDCGITSLDLYTPPTIHGNNARANPPYCRNRATLLEAMSGGGRHGFDAPFAPK